MGGAGGGAGGGGVNKTSECHPNIIHFLLYHIQL